MPQMNRTQQAEVFAWALRPRLTGLDTRSQGDVLDEALTEASRRAAEGDTRIWVTFGAWLAAQYDADYDAFNRWCKRVLRLASK